MKKHIKQYLFIILLSAFLCITPESAILSESFGYISEVEVSSTLTVNKADNDTAKKLQA